MIYITKIALRLNAIKLVEGCDVDSWPDHIAMTSLVVVVLAFLNLT
jgi:hypothetical protein